MAHVKRIGFAQVGEKQGCTCDRCGQYIRNIWSVQYAEGFTVHYGIDCFEKVYKSGRLSQYGQKEMRRIMKSIEGYEKRIAEWESGEVTPETNYSWQEAQKDKLNPWYGATWEAYKDWMINEFFKYHLEEAQKELEKFRNIDFTA